MYFVFFTFFFIFFWFKSIMILWVCLLRCCFDRLYQRMIYWLAYWLIVFFTLNLFQTNWWFIFELPIWSFNVTIISYFLDIHLSTTGNLSTHVGSRWFGLKPLRIYLRVKGIYWLMLRRILRIFENWSDFTIFFCVLLLALLEWWLLFLERWD